MQNPSEGLAGILATAELYAKETGGIIKAEHLLVSVLAHGESYAAHLLFEAGVSHERVSAVFRVEAAAPRVAYSADAKRVVEGAARLARELGAKAQSADILTLSLLTECAIPVLPQAVSAEIVSRLLDFQKKLAEAADAANCVKIEIKRPRTKG